MMGAKPYLDTLLEFQLNIILIHTAYISLERTPELVSRRACGPVDVGTCPYQLLAATLTLFQPRGADYAHHIHTDVPTKF